MAIGAGKIDFVFLFSAVRKKKLTLYASPFKSWQRVYSYDMAFNLTESEAENILGGEVALWSEQTDSTTLDTRLW